MCSSPKDRGVHLTKYKHLHSYNDVSLDKSHHYAELANSAQRRRDDLKKMEQRYNKRHPHKKNKKSFWYWLKSLFGK